MGDLSLTPQSVRNFWDGVGGDLRDRVYQLEASEPWTYEYSELPDFFRDLELLLPDTVAYPVPVETEAVLENLVILLASVPYTTCIASLSYLEQKSLQSEAHEPGWGMVLYKKGCHMRTGDSEHSILAKVTCDRVETLVKSGVSIQSFLQGDYE